MGLGTFRVLHYDLVPDFTDQVKSGTFTLGPVPPTPDKTTVTVHNDGKSTDHSSLVCRRPELSPHAVSGAPSFP